MTKQQFRTFFIIALACMSIGARCAPEEAPHISNQPNIEPVTGEQTTQDPPEEVGQPILLKDNELQLVY